MGSLGYGCEVILCKYPSICSCPLYALYAPSQKDGGATPLNQTTSLAACAKFETGSGITTLYAEVKLEKGKSEGIVNAVFYPGKGLTGNGKATLFFIQSTPTIVNTNPKDLPALSNILEIDVKLQD